MAARVLVTAVAPLAALVMWRPGYDVFLTAKSTLVVAGALLLVVVGAVRVARSGLLAIPPAPVAAALAAFVVALTAATVAADRPMLAVVGRAGRHTGLALVLAAVVVLIAAAVAFRDGRVGLPVAALLASAVPVVAYAIVQAAGADPLAWALVEGGPPVFSTLGNASFLSGWLGIVATLGVAAALASGWRPWWRAGAVVLSASALVGAALTGSVQGVVAAGVGFLVVGVGWAAATRGRGWTVRAAVAAVAAVVAAGAGLLVMADPGQQLAGGLANRWSRWEVAWRMAADHPWLGVGPAHFASYAARYATPEAAAARGLDRILDDAHDVPLTMLSSGGWPLAVSWVAVVAGVVVVAAAGWRRGDTARRLTLSGLLGAWVAYLVQALVSIDVAPLAVTGWLLAGLVVAVSGTVREVAVPTVPARPAGAVVAVMALALVPLSFVPLRADLEAAHAVAAARHDADEEAANRYAAASRLAWWEARYPMLEGRWWNREGDLEQARAAFEEAHRRDPGAVVGLVNVARLSIALGDLERAREAYAEALRVAPTNPDVREEAAPYVVD